MKTVTLDSSRTTQHGFGIIEIMVALALGIIIMLGVTQVATDNSALRYELDRTGRQMENAAFALGEIESDLMSAGFWGEMGDQTNGDVLPESSRWCPASACSLGDFPDLNDDSCQLNRAMRFPVQGGSEEVDCATADAAEPDKITPKAGSDFLAVRRANSCALGSDGCNAAGGNFHLQVEACFVPGDDDAPLPGIDYALDAIDGAPDFTVFEHRQRDCDATASLAARAPIYRMLNRVYYINDNDQLVRADLVADEYELTPLVDGIETMRLEYGMDRDGDGQIDDDVNGYVLDPTTDYSTDPPTDDVFTEGWSDVVMVRVSVVVRNTEPSAGFTDTRDYVVAGADYNVPAEFAKHRRQVYVRTVGLRNVAGRRQE
jgi:type IV pilus assembly protein PilW